MCHPKRVPTAVKNRNNSHLGPGFVIKDGVRETPNEHHVIIMPLGMNAAEITKRPDVRINRA